MGIPADSFATRAAGLIGMATNTERKWGGKGSTAKRRRNRDQDQDQEQLKILRLDLYTIMEQIRMLDHELEVDHCLSPTGIATIMSLIDTLKHDLEGTRLRIRELKGSTAA
jgi:hypothetical protein